MAFVDQGHAVTIVTQIVFIDLLLSGDNAVVIALACRGMPAKLRLRALFAGTAAAIVLRTLLTAIAGLLEHLPLLELIGAGLLLIIAIRLLLAEEQDPHDTSAESAGLWSAITTIVVADLAMSTDNVVAIAAAAQDSFAYLAMGLLLSIPLLMFGSVWIGRLIETRPLLIPAGAAMLGWIAGQLAVSDPLVAASIQAHAPAMQVVFPALCAAFVVLEGGVIRRQRLILGPGPRFPLRARRTIDPRPPANGHGEEIEPHRAGTTSSIAAFTLAASPNPIGQGPKADESATISGPMPATRAMPAADESSDKPAIERRVLNILSPVIAATVLILLSWVALRVFDASSFLPPPKHRVPPDGSVQRPTLPSAPR